jgi:hypothetical protein
MSHPVALPPPPPAAPFAPKKGDVVEYRQRDGSWVQAKVAAVDPSVAPPSYGIELGGPGGPSYRETEGDRLRLLDTGGAEAPVQGLGHFDASTEAKEAAVRELE